MRPFGRQDCRSSRRQKLRADRRRRPWPNSSEKTGIWIFRAELYKEEFYTTKAWATASTRDAPGQPLEQQCHGRAEGLRLVRKPERPGTSARSSRSNRALVHGRVLWYDLLGFGPESHPLIERAPPRDHPSGGICRRVLQGPLQPGSAVGPRARAVPPIPAPGLPAYPGGHSTQIYLMALTLAVPGARQDHRDHGDRRRSRRQSRAGRSSTTGATRKQARSWPTASSRILTSECAMFRSLLEEAKQKEWGAATDRDATPREAILRT